MSYEDDQDAIVDSAREVIYLENKISHLQTERQSMLRQIGQRKATLKHARSRLTEVKLQLDTALTETRELEKDVLWIRSKWLLNKTIYPSTLEDVRESRVYANRLG